MKGLVFTEFLEMVENQAGLEAVDRLISTVDPPSGGAYTAVGTYPHEELVDLTVALSDQIDVPVPDLLEAFGHHCFTRFNAAYPQFFEGVDGTFEFLKTIEEHIHVEVRKLYPDAELPHFEYEEPEPGELLLHYRSSRPFADFCAGLVRGCTEFFGEGVTVQREDDADGGRRATFRLRHT